MATIPPIDFLVNLTQFGQDKGYLYMVFEFIPGGELFSLLRSVGRIPEITATFYGAQVWITDDRLLFWNKNSKITQNYQIYKLYNPYNIFKSIIKSKLFI